MTNLFKHGLRFMNMMYLLQKWLPLIMCNVMETYNRTVVVTFNNLVMVYGKWYMVNGK